MFETAEVGNTVAKDIYKQAVPELRARLLAAQTKLRASGTAVVIIVGGVEGAGKSETVNLLLEWMDARGIDTVAFGDPSDEERQRPRFWRFWRNLPAKGRIGILLGSWYTKPIIGRVFGQLTDAEVDQELDRITELERMLTSEGVVLVKLWLHLAKDLQKKRLEKLEKDPKTAWRVSPLDWKFFKKYDKFRLWSEHALRRTSTGEAPWTIVEGADERYRSLTAVGAVLAAIEEGLSAAAERKAKPAEKEPLPEPKPVNILSRLDLTRALAKEPYESLLLKWQGRLNALTRRLHEQGRSMICLFEGPDAAGKGGAIRRLTVAMDARNYSVISVAAPTDEERAQPYLWRFWRHLPRLGRVTIYDRSWYGRVLVERVEGFCPPDAWRRAYGEINAFEEQLTDFGIVLVKQYLVISPEEQLRRFEERQEVEYKQHKITEEDWRNRAKWGAYEAAVCEMIERTSTPLAPWTLVEANDKRWGRIKVLETVCKRLASHLGNGRE